MAWNCAGNAEPGHTICIVKLVVCVGHDQHGTTGSHRLGRRPDAALVDDGSGPWEKLRKRCVSKRLDTLGKRSWSVTSVFADEQDGPAPQPFGGCDTVFVERACINHRRRAEREDQRRRAGIEEANQLRGHSGFAVPVIEREAGDNGLARPVGLLVGQ
jgi:hypothetical protein